ncbi:beta-glucuronidase-like isoform X1 [Hermetia illucens]|uniref:beta-glucuronidase-like isoform X1 n=2 Tax=Hermetia illucens TaxID=343691 RepID=UPI0018CBFE55|nr:beta-glucuronidase-like isoform X1 [Hermetia illucens]XP_037915443.1 beta-glucuronidase-like isoform X1 [Hermetia illucens]
MILRTVRNALVGRIGCLVTTAFSLLAMGAIAYVVNFAFGLVLMNSQIPQTKGLLYPRESETREVRSLDGIWNFVKSEKYSVTQGIREHWYKNDLSRVRKTIPMPVPASYNDIGEDADLRDHVGTVWYDRRFFIPKHWQKEQRVWIRFGSVHYDAHVWVNGVQVLQHEIGHLPFEAEISNVVKYGEENLITVLCDNALLKTTVPQGNILEKATDDGVTLIQSYSFDFFNYAGIHRSVVIYTTPKLYIEDVTVTTDLSERKGIVQYEVKINGDKGNWLTYVKVNLRNKEGDVVSTTKSGSDLQGVLIVDNVKPWWPYLMHPEYGYLYTLEISLCNEEQQDIDIYRLKVGIRTLAWDKSRFLINGEPVYFRGFGRHEDADIRGKGLDLALLTKDFNLIKWIGANSYRTSHYPYSEESMQFADEHGIMIIDECPSVDTEHYGQALLDKHESSIEQLIHRDKNHPSVVMWSIANEPRTASGQADAYFERVANFTKTLDNTRPITAAIATPAWDDKAAKHLDIISFNRYNGWYSNPGHLDMVTQHVVEEADSWHKRHDKPVLMSEYGADTLEGYHSLPEFVWSEEYQSKILSQHFKAFDLLRKHDWFIGEFVWNFADFKTAQGVTRAGGNKKGIFTRNRHPKAAAHLLRQRYFSICKEERKICQIPNDVFLYVSEREQQLRDRSEL